MSDIEEGFRKALCVECDATFLVPLRGGIPSRCPLCAEVRRGRKFVCAVCGKIKKAANAGAIPRVCVECLGPYHVDCVRCHQPFELPAKTREPKLCDGCRTSMIREYYSKQRAATTARITGKMPTGRPVTIQPPPRRIS